jgi:hypothetical protein
MGADTFIEDFKNSLEFIPVEGTPHAYWIRVRKPLAPTGDMTAEDWDKFEKDIADAFETVP